MKARINISVIALFLFISVINAQIPRILNYQAVVRDAGGNPIVNTSIGLRMSILRTSSTGTSVCTEEFSTATNDYGLVASK